jgi:formylglycine-generating enzyme required for sulfatase activity
MEDFVFFKEFVREINGVAPSPVELAEILWLLIQRHKNTVITDGQESVLSDGQRLNLSPNNSESIIENDSASIIENDSASIIEDDSGSIVEGNSSVLSSSIRSMKKPLAAIVTELPPPSQNREESRSSLPIRVPDAPALRNRQEISRAMRPLLRRVSSRVREIIDEEATAVQIAENKIWNPVIHSEKERWLELTIVIEVTSLIDVWRDTITEFQQLLEQQGIFRNVSTWQLQVVANEQPQLFLQTVNGLKKQPRSPKELLDTSGRRLILFLSDCTSDGWRSGKIFKLLTAWSQMNPVTIVQLLPYRYWEQSALGSGYPVTLRSHLAGSLNRDWLIDGLSIRQQQRLQKGIKFPVITIQPQSLKEWAQAFAATGNQRTTGIVLGIKAFSAEQPTDLELQQLTAKQLVHKFQRTASVQAQELLDAMSGLPVSWPVLRLIQEHLRQRAGQPIKHMSTLYLAEVFLSGLLYPVKKGQKEGRVIQEYDFVPGVRDILLRSMPISEADKVNEEISEKVFNQLPESIREKISAYISKHFKNSLNYFDAFLIPDLQLGDAFTEIKSFAQVREETLKLWGGEYAKWAERLKQGETELFPSINSNEYIEISSLQEIEFEVVTISFEDRLSLELFNFNVATIQPIGKESSWQRKQEWKIHHQPSQAYQFVELLDDGIILEMVMIPKGSFLMGSSDEDSAKQSNENPQHLVHIEKFYLGKYPVTQAQWRFVSSLPLVKKDLKMQPSRFKGENLPVEQVSWFEAEEFCNRLSNWTGRHYRLPSEAEWEYSCRARTTTSFYFGTTIFTDVANYNGDYTNDLRPLVSRSGTTTPVGSFDAANAFGLYDMHGNVWEWCLDNFHLNYKGAPSNGTPWLKQNDNSSRLLRGGSWANDLQSCRSAFRYGFNAPDGHFSYIGFRVVCDATTTPQ